MQIEILADVAAVAQRAAEFVADRARKAVATRGRFVMAVSGGTTPWQMLRALADEADVPWREIQFVQVDERVAPDGNADRNLTHLTECLVGKSPLSIDQIHPMPVNMTSLEEAARSYEQVLAQVAGPERLLDLVHLGLGTDGHTASLIPGDASLDVVNGDVAPVGTYQGRRRLTLTYPTINRSREILWLVTGESKAEMVQRLLRQDHTIPSGRVTADRATLLMDQPAAKSPPS
jgi:6-phosphogluconolactonase